MKHNLNRTQMAGLILLALSVPLAAGIINPWLASTETWEYTEVRAIYAPRTLAPGTQIKTVTVLAYNGWKKGGDVLVDVLIPGYSAWQFTQYVNGYTEANLTLTFYRSIPVMPEGPLTITAEAEMGRTQASVTIYPTDTQPTESPDVEGEVYVNDIKVEVGSTITVDTLDLTIRVIITEGASSIQSVYGAVDDQSLIFDVDSDPTEYTATHRLPGDGSYDVNIRVLDTGGGDTQLASFGVELGTQEPWFFEAIDETVQDTITRYAPLASTRTMILGGFTALAGAGFTLYGFSLEEKRR